MHLIQNSHSTHFQINLWLRSKLQLVADLDIEYSIFILSNSI